MTNKKWPTYLLVVVFSTIVFTVLYLIIRKRSDTNERSNQQRAPITVKSIKLDGDSNLKGIDGQILHQNVSELDINTFASGSRVPRVWADQFWLDKGFKGIIYGDPYQDVTHVYKSDGSVDLTRFEANEFFTKVGNVVSVQGMVILHYNTIGTTRKLALDVPIQPYSIAPRSEATMSPFYKDDSVAGYQTSQLQGTVTIMTTNTGTIDPSPNARTWYNNFVNNLDAMGACVGFVPNSGQPGVGKLFVSIGLHDGGTDKPVFVNYSYMYSMTGAM